MSKETNEDKFQRLLLATRNADLIDAWADLKQEMANIMLAQMDTMDRIKEKIKS